MVEGSFFCNAEAKDVISDLNKKINVNPAGLGTFGFSSFAELWNGRLAMLGFIAAIGTEALTGKGIFQQIGLDTPLDEILILIALLGLTIATTVGYYAINAADKIASGKPKAPSS
mmetsp:Transcript_26430/g.45515  ORF Transcript_26430/g.45515 Transcript_26430/m.45515 type:complete len:115 (+) Transcript_26430:188-532(+)